ncbi:hypothetical protein E308F_08900 [Moorella sp. E308F]|uniref:DUF2206 domain-containing protein n=1 Tax=Moorella sp. E308F TaxID=2572682 RepID=UPI0010FFBEE8|nr:DUF2206 domain-containing protein [Moorella sp. E308F]GEA14648.1 hypothetical protein E308F_08900 [Moorella sp. E308F]
MFLIKSQKLQRKDLMFIAVFFLVTIEFILLEHSGIHLFGLRQVFSFIFFTYIPGYLLLHILKFNIDDKIKLILFSVGLSISYLMITALLINLIYPLFGISKPITFWPVLVSCIVTTFLLLVICSFYMRKENNIYPDKVSQMIKTTSYEKILPIYVVLLSILAAYYIRNLENNIIALCFIVLVEGLFVFYTFKNSTRETLSLIIYSISLAMLLVNVLYSKYLTGYDINVEYYFQHLTWENGFWNYSIPGTVNTTISIVLLAPIYSLLTGLNVIDVFKVFYQIIYSLVPVALFVFYSVLFDYKKSFLAIALFMSIPTFFLEMPALARQEIAELFFVLILLLIFDKSTKELSKRIIFIVFSFSLIISHYGLGYVSIGYLIVAFITYVVIQKPMLLQRDNMLRPNLITIFFVLLIIWYMYIATGSPFNVMVGIGNTIILHLKDILGLSTRENLISTAIGLDFWHVSTLGKLFRISQYLIEMFIVIGYISYYFYCKHKREHMLFFSFATGAALLLFACIAIPYFSTFMNITRFFHFALFFLAPMFVEGIDRFILLCARILKLASDRFNAKYLASNTLAIVIISIYFLFNSGFIFEVFGFKTYGTTEIPFTYSLSGYRIDGPFFTTQEYNASLWADKYLPANARIYGDEYRRLLLIDFRNGRVKVFSHHIEQPSFFFLGELNTLKNQASLIVSHKAQKRLEIVDLDLIKDLKALIS